MYKFITISLTLLISFSLIGCKSMPSQWQTYNSSFDDTWNAVIRTVTNMTGKEPVSVDKSKGKIVTNVFYGDIVETEETRDISKDTQIKEYRKDVEAYVATIAVQPVGENTRVMVSAQQGNVFTTQSLQEMRLNENPGVGLGFTVTNDREFLNKFLNKLKNEIENPTKQHPPDQLIEQLKAQSHLR